MANLGSEVRFNAGSFMCAAATHGDRDKLEWAISSKQGEELQSSDTPAVYKHTRVGREALEFQNTSGQVIHYIYIALVIQINTC